MPQTSSTQRLIVVGKVTSTKDPDGLGRIQVQLSGFDRAVQLPWVRQVQPYASSGAGWMMLPEEGDEVVILQGSGNTVDQMVCLGSVYNGNAKPATPNNDGSNDKKALRTRAGHELLFDDHSGGEVIHLATPDGKLSLDLEHASGKITIKSATEIVLSCPSGDVRVRCSNANIEASSSVTIRGGAQVNVSAAQISLSGVVDLG